jgi:hypothetical protein
MSSIVNFNGTKLQTKRTQTEPVALEGKAAHSSIRWLKTSHLCSNFWRKESGTSMRNTRIGREVVCHSMQRHKSTAVPTNEPAEEPQMMVTLLFDMSGGWYSDFWWPATFTWCVEHFHTNQTEVHLFICLGGIFHSTTIMRNLKLDDTQNLAKLNHPVV